MEHAYRISILVVFDDHTTFDETAEALGRQTLLPAGLETIAVNPFPDLERCKQSVARIGPDLRSRINLSIIDAPNVGRATGWNQAMAASTGDLLLFLADDFVPGEKWLESHVRFHGARPEPHIVGIGPGCFTEKLRQDPLMFWLEDSGEQFGVPFTKQNTIPPGFFYGANTSIKRAFIETVGPFDEDFPFHTTDDWEMGLRLKAAGMQTVYLPEALAWHEHDVKLKDRYDSMVKSGMSSAIYDAKHQTGPTLHPSCRYSAWGHRWRACVWRLIAAFGGDFAQRAYWHHTFARGYMTGYQSHLRKNRRSKAATP